MSKMGVDVAAYLIYTPSMPNVRAPGQKPILLSLTQRFLDAVDEAYRQEGFDDRSKFIREAVWEKLERMGIKVPLDLRRLMSAATGKGWEKNKLLTGRGGM